MKNHTLLTLLLAVFIALLGIGIIVPIMPVFARDLGANGFGLGMIIAAFSITRGLLQPIIGNASDKMGRKNFLLAGLIIYAIVGLLIPLAESVNQLITIRGFHGVGSAMIVPIAMAYVSLLSPAGKEASYMSYLNIAVFCGIGCGPVIGGALFDLWGLTSVFNTMALLSFLAFVFVLRYLPEKQSSDLSKRRSLTKSLRLMLTNRKTSGILLARYATMIIMVPTMAFLPLLMSGWNSVSGVQIGIVIACRTLVNAVLQVPFGRLADRYNKLPGLVVCSVALCTILFFIPVFDSFLQMAAAYLALGTFEAGIWAILGGYASLEAKKLYGHGTMMGIFSFAMSFGVFTGAVLAGTSMDQWGLPRAYQVTACVVLFLTITASVLIGLEEKNRETTEPALSESRR